jgi:hypothetical protein
MTIFSRYNDSNDSLVEKTTDQLSELIKDEQNRNEIAELIFHRIYDRFLKIFFFEPEIFKKYKIKELEEEKDSFHYEYKSGFLMMSSACSVIETMASFLQGNDKTIGIGNENFKIVFEKCIEYENELKEFSNQNIYKSVRNGILHQGESYDNYKIVRSGPLYDRPNNKINATRFIKHLKDFLISYKHELQNEATKWDSEIWDNCRTKIRHIIKKEEK